MPATALAQLNPDTLALLAGAVLSLLISYVPGIREKFAALTPERKRIWMALLLLAVAAVIFGGSCTGLGLFPSATCDQPGALAMVRVLLLAVVSNQGVFSISPYQTKPVPAQPQDAKPQ